MQKRKGVPVSPGIAVSAALTIRDSAPAGRSPERRIRPHHVDAELDRLMRAMTATRNEILAVREQAERSGAPEAVRIVESHLAFLDDPEIVRELVDLVNRDHLAPESSVERVFGKWEEELKGGSLAGRAEDVRDVGSRVLRNLGGKPPGVLAAIDREVILAATEISPSETASLDPRRVVGIATEVGGKTSHAAIVAKGLGIPFVSGIKGIAALVRDGDTLIVDGKEGVLITDPDEPTLSAYRRKIEKEGRRRTEALASSQASTARSRDGVEIIVNGNIEFPWEAEACVRGGGAGVGLFRTEFLFREGGQPPTEETQFAAYRQAIESLGGRPLTIRTMDFGADKAPGDWRLSRSAERNPALGCRSLRYSFEHPDLFRSQLRAILRAAATGPVKLLFPMVSSLEDLRRARQFLDEARASLKKERVPAAEEGALPVGIMIEVPAAALITSHLLAEADFVSIGTNDLVQYALAVDRVNERVAALHEPAHPGILRLLSEVVGAALRAGKPVSVCGEIGSEPPFVLFLFGLGLREWSVGPSSIPDVKRLVASLRTEEAHAAALRALELPTAREVRAHLRTAVQQAAKGVVTA